MLSAGADRDPLFALSWMPEPAVFMATARAHRATRNALRWQPDVSFRKDAARNRKGHGPVNIAILRRRAAGVARRDTSKGSLSIKLKRRVERCVSSEPSQSVSQPLGQTRLPCLQHDNQTPSHAAPMPTPPSEQTQFFEVPTSVPHLTKDSHM